MKIRFIRLAVIFIVATIVLLGTATPAFAADIRSGNTITIPAGEVINEDLFIFGNTIIIDGTVNGDVFAFGQTITINGDIDGSATVAGQTITFNGDVSRGARIAGQTLSINGNIGRDLMAAGASLNVSGTSEIGKSLFVASNSAQINGRVVDGIRGSLEELTIADGVGGDVRVNVNNLTITSTANITGDVIYTSKNEANIQTGSRVGGTVTRHEPAVDKEPTFFTGIAGTVVGKVLGFFMIFLIGIIVILVAPRQVALLTKSLRARPAHSLGWGAVILFVTPVAALIVMFTVIGIPLGLITLALLGISIYLAQIPVALLIGWLILRSSRELDSRGFMIGALALGLFLLLLLRLIPFVSWLFTLFIVLFGLGTLVTVWQFQGKKTT